LVAWRRTGEFFLWLSIAGREGQARRGGRHPLGLGAGPDRPGKFRRAPSSFWVTFVQLGHGCAFDLVTVILCRVVNQ
jgi:hypothetical protein